MNKMNRRFAWQFVAAFVIVLACAASTAAQTVVVGTGNPDIDVPAVQAGVDQGGDVVLRGHFSFDRPPTVPTAPQGFYPPAMVLVSKAVTISAARDERDDDREMTTIEAGTIPFYVEAPGAAVTIQGLRFVRPKSDAVLVYAVSGLVIASCKIEGVEPLERFAMGISIDTSGSPSGPGHPENISGTLLIANNAIDVAGGTASDQTLGVVIYYVGVPGAEVEAYVSGNTTENVTERPISLRQIGGRAYVEGNAIATGTIAGPHGGVGSNPDAIYVFGSGSYLVAHNSIHHQWATGNGITASATTHASVVDNNINMEAPDCTVFGENSSGIDVRGNDAHGNVVLKNRIRGCARAALAVLGSADTAFVLNHFDDFEASVADIFVREDAMNTRIVGQGTVEDHGVGTVIVPVPNFGRHHEEGGDENRNQTGEEPREK